MLLHIDFAYFPLNLLHEFPRILSKQCEDPLSFRLDLL